MSANEGTGSEDGARSPLLPSDRLPPLSARVQVDFGARTRAGRRSRKSADHFLVLRLGRHQETLLTSLPSENAPVPFREFGYAMLVADGGGEEASRMAIGLLVDLARHFGEWSLRIDAQTSREVMERVERFYRQVDNILGSHRPVDGASTPMHTTLTGLFSAGSDCFFAHVGHSRAYLFRQGQMVQITRDHTVGARTPPALAGAPPLTQDLAHELNQVIGGPPGSLLVDVERFRLLDRDALLVCSNGLTDVVPDGRIGEVLKRDVTADEKCQELLDLARSAGGDDDATALVAHYRIPV